MRGRSLAPVILSIALGCGGTAQSEAPPPPELSVPESPGIRVETATVHPSTARLDVSFPAEVQAIEDVSLASPMGGYVEAVKVKAGTKLSKGQLIAQVDSASRAAQRDVAVAQATQAEAELHRMLRLGDGVSEAQVLAAQTTHKVASANARLAQLGAQRSVIRAPFHGTVAEVYVEEGEVAGPGAPIARVVRVDTVKLEVAVSDRDITLVDDGQAVTFRTQADPKGFTGKVSRRGVAADSKSRQFNVEVEIPNPDRNLLPGMLGRVYFDRLVAEDAIVIPQDWLVTRRDATGVFVDDGGVARWRDVVVESLARDQAIIGSGLSSGDAVVMTGHRNLADGDKLIVARSGRCCAGGRVEY